MSLDARTDSSTASELRPRHGWLALVAVILAVQLVLAVVALASGPATRYGWHMYAAVPYVPETVAIVDGAERRFDLREMVLHPRIEIDYVALLRERGCELAGADAIRFELANGTEETVTCR